MNKKTQALVTEAKRAFDEELTRQFAQYCNRNVGEINFNPYTWKADVEALLEAVLNDDAIDMSKVVVAEFAETIMDEIREDFLADFSDRQALKDDPHKYHGVSRAEFI